MSELPIELYKKIIEHAPNVFCAFLFVNKHTHAICKEIINSENFSKYLLQYTKGSETCSILPWARSFMVHMNA